MVTVSDSELNFGSCSRLSTGSHKVLTVTNTTAAKVTAFLAVPDWQGYGSQAQAHQVFQVGAFCQTVQRADDAFSHASTWRESILRCQAAGQTWQQSLMHTILASCILLQCHQTTK